MRARAVCQVTSSGTGQVSNRLAFVTTFQVAVGGCGHGLCVKCAYRLCARGGLALPCCPFCRSTIAAFETAAGMESADAEQPAAAAAETKETAQAGNITAEPAGGVACADAAAA